MSAVGGDTFGFADDGFAPLDNGTTVLLTGDDSEALERVFYRLSAGRGEESTVVLSTNDDARSVQRGLDDVASGAGGRTRVLATEGPDRDDDVTRVADLTDLTSLGMEFSAAVTDVQATGGRFRAGILVASSILEAVEDTRSVYRFLNANFLNQFRRGDGVGVCAVDTGTEFGAGTASTVAGLETSFGCRVDVVEADRREATLDVSGLGARDGEATLSLR
ncbi:hypothetical protein RYH80_17830 [Halobaculum sp. MBLA0147]|uniref:DUF7504 family protein n=1 Tax=Halobaculum sp. MBLA0147 TaxID=3079934 RepID=UPI003526B11B